MSPSRAFDRFASQYPLQLHSLTGEETEIVLILVKRHISRLKNEANN